MTAAEPYILEYGIIPNSRGKDFGHLPYYGEAGFTYCNTWASRGYDKDQALAMAKSKAEEMLARGFGDEIRHIENPTIRNRWER